ncbi:hypothetical protein U9M48_020108 [Paspalum notatum var. saurae]|uniref:RanBP2-type domain-containing protein n=1 Tax=Paspalum notatum var. saurae TaxID=547442 RepID=A0AAQ3WRC7_PASNO
MGAAMGKHRRPPRLYVDPPKELLPLLGLQVLYAYGCSGARAPATAALLAANVLIFLRPGPLHGILPKKAYVAFNPQLFLKFRDLKTLLSPLYHSNEAHLFCNMTALLWTGIRLEELMGTAEFASMVPALHGLSLGITVLLAKGLCLLGDDAAYYDHHSVGFSGVIYGMAVVLAWSDKFMPLKFGVFADLFLSKALVPNAGFLGHLGGILAGFVYHLLRCSLKRADPLTFLISHGIKSMALPLIFAQKLKRSVLQPKGHMIGGGRDGCRASAREYPRGIWTCSTCSHYNTLVTDVCEKCSSMREGYAFSQRQHHQALCNGELPVEEIRRRRLDRFDR